MVRLAVSLGLTRFGFGGQWFIETKRDVDRVRRIRHAGEFINTFARKYGSDIDVLAEVVLVLGVFVDSQVGVGLFLDVADRAVAIGRGTGRRHVPLAVVFGVVAVIDQYLVVRFQLPDGRESPPAPLHPHHRCGAPRCCIAIGRRAQRGTLRPTHRATRTGGGK